MCYNYTNNVVIHSQHDTVEDSDVAPQFTVTGVDVAQNDYVRDAYVTQHYEDEDVDLAQHVSDKDFNGALLGNVMINETDQHFHKSPTNERNMSVVSMEASYTINIFFD